MSGNRSSPPTMCAVARPIPTQAGGFAPTRRGTGGYRTKGQPQTAATHILRRSRRERFTSPAFGRGFQIDRWRLTWALKHAGIEGSQPLAWSTSAIPRALFTWSCDRRSDDGKFGNAEEGALYDPRRGEHWSRIALPQGGETDNGLAIDQRDPARLVPAAWGRSTAPSPATAGIYLSTNRGTTWRACSIRPAIYDVTIDPQDPRQSCMPLVRIHGVA